MMKMILLLASALAAFAQTSAAVSQTSSASGAATSPAFLPQIGDTGGPPPAGIVRNGAVKTLNWNIGYVENVSRANYTRRMIGVNGAWPIPAITLDYNDTFILNVVNNLDKGTAIHFHGMFQYGTQNMDGPVMVAQCPIPPGASYTYQFQAGQWGTYWIHAHFKGEYVDGLRTALVINPPPTVQMAPFDKEYVISISDWYNLEHPVVLSSFLSPYNPAGNEPVPNAGLFNEVDNASIDFTPGKTYKLRFVSFGALVTYDFYIEGHDMYVVEVDGVDCAPSLQSSFALAPAQRVAVIVTARGAGNGTDVNYNIHAVMESGMFEHVPPNVNFDVTMQVTYNSASSAQMFNSPGAPDFTDIMDETTLTATAPLDSLPNPDPSNSFAIYAAFQVFSDGLNHGSFNNTPYQSPAVPALYTAISAGTNVNNPLIYGSATVPMVVQNINDVAEIIIVNTDSGTHPFHLHGHVFQIIILTNNTFDPTNPYPNPLPTNPMRRDTISIPGGGYAILRFLANNPGVWILHCHIEWHFEAGLMVTLIEAPSKIQSTIDPVMQGFCQKQGIPVQGNAAGNLGLDLSGYNYGPAMLPGGITSTGWGAMVACAISSFVGVATVIWFSKKDEVLDQE